MNQLQRESIPYTMIENALIDSTELTIHEKMAFLVLCRFADNMTGKSFPSYATIAKLMRCTRKMAIKAIEGLVIKEKIIRKQRARKDGSKSSNLYTIKRVIHRGGGVPGSLGGGVPGSLGGVPGTHRINPNLKKTKKEKEEESAPPLVIDGIGMDASTTDEVSEFQAQYGDNNFRTVFDEYKAAKRPEQYRFVDQDLPELLNRFRAKRKNERWEGGKKVGHYDEGRYIPKRVPGVLSLDRGGDTPPLSHGGGK
ncbi:hypothetical protein ES705_17573 [subsurface metagenome]